MEPDNKAATSERVHVDGQSFAESPVNFHEVFKRTWMAVSSTTDFRSLGRLGGTKTVQPRARRNAWMLRRARQLQSQVHPHVIGSVVVAILAMVFVVLLYAPARGVEPVTAFETVVTEDLRSELVLGTGQASAASFSLVPAGTAAEPVTPAQSDVTIAAVQALRLVAPVENPDGITFQEADTATAIALLPVGTAVANLNDSFVVPEALPGPEYTVAEPRFGVRPATGSVVMFATPLSIVTAPIDGVVTDVVDEDEGTTLVIESFEDPSLRVVIDNIEASSVTTGTVVEIGDPISTVKQGTPVMTDDNPLGLPHVRLWVEPAVTPLTHEVG